MGTIKIYQPKRNGMATNDGTNHLTLHLTREVLRAGSVAPSIRLELINAHMPASEQHTQLRKSRLGQ